MYKNVKFLIGKWRERYVYFENTSASFQIFIRHYNTHYMIDTAYYELCEFHHDFIYQLFPYSHGQTKIKQVGLHVIAGDQKITLDIGSFPFTPYTWL